MLHHVHVFTETGTGVSCSSSHASKRHWILLVEKKRRHLQPRVLLASQWLGGHGKLLDTGEPTSRGRTGLEHQSRTQALHSSHEPALWLTQAHSLIEDVDNIVIFAMRLKRATHRERSLLQFVRSSYRKSIAS